MNTAARPRPADNRIGFAFNASPKIVRAMIREKTLKRIDGDLLELLLSLRFTRKDSCWCPKSFAAVELGVTPRTIQSSLARLDEHGFIVQIEVAKPDPDDPRNRTGWRIHFPWILGRPIAGRRPNRRPNAERCKLTFEAGEDFFSPPQEQEISPPSGAKISPNPLPTGGDRSNQTTTTGASPGSQTPPEIHACEPSPSSFAPLGGRPGNPGTRGGREAAAAPRPAETPTPGPIAPPRAARAAPAGPASRPASADRAARREAQAIDEAKLTDLAVKLMILWGYPDAGARAEIIAACRMFGDRDPAEVLTWVSHLVGKAETLGKDGFGYVINGLRGIHRKGGFKPPPDPEQARRIRQARDLLEGLGRSGWTFEPKDGQLHPVPINPACPPSHPIAASLRPDIVRLKPEILEILGGRARKAAGREGGAR